MYLKSITINNFKSIQKATANFEDGLNIVIGKNGAGKSNLLEFIYKATNYFFIIGHSVPYFRNVNLDYAFSLSYSENNSWNEFIFEIKREKNKVNDEIEFSNEVKFNHLNNGELLYRDKILKIGNEKANTPESRKARNILRGLRRIFVSFAIPDNPFWLSLPARFEIDTDVDVIGVEVGGMSITQQLETLINMEFDADGKITFERISVESIRERFFELFTEFAERYQLNAELARFSPIEEIRLNPNVNVYKADKKFLIENLLIDFKVNGSWIPWNYLSDGTKRLFYLITECLSLEDGLVLIEEPELGVHPHQLFLLMNFLKEQSRHKQIIVSTHSPIVLDVLKSDELNRITIAKLEQDGSQFYKLTNEQIIGAKTYMQSEAELSYYWLHSDLEDND